MCNNTLPPPKPEVRTYLDLRVDWAFKYIFSQKDNLLKLLNDLLPVQVTDLEYLPNEIPVMSDKDKRATLDVLCTSPGGKFIVEMQNRPEVDMDDRLAFYGASLVHNQVKRGDDAYSVRPVYVVCIARYVREHGADMPPEKVLFSYHFRETETGEPMAGAKLSFHFLELSRLSGDWDDLSDNSERWCYLFQKMTTFAGEGGLPGDLCGFESLVEAARTDQLNDEQKEAYHTSMSKQYELYTSNLYQYRKGLAEGREEGRNEGIRDNQLETARRMLADGMAVDLVAKYSGLPEETVKGLQQGE